MAKLFILLVIGLFFVTGCGEDSPQDRGWTEERLSEQQQNCLQGLPSEAACRCLVDKLSEEFTYDEYVALEDKPEQDPDKQRASTIGLQCIAGLAIR